MDVSSGMSFCNLEKDAIVSFRWELYFAKDSQVENKKEHVKNILGLGEQKGKLYICKIPRLPARLVVLQFWMGDNNNSLNVPRTPKSTLRLQAFAVHEWLEACVEILTADWWSRAFTLYCATILQYHKLYFTNHCKSNIRTIRPLSSQTILHMHALDHCRIAPMRG